MISKRPTAETLRTRSSTRPGASTASKAAFDFSGPIDQEQKFLYRLVGLARKTDTVIDFTNEKHGFVAPSFTWQPTSDTTFTILTSYPAR